MSEEIEVETWFPDHIFRLPVGWRSARRRVAILRAITDLRTGVLSLRVWKASYIGQWRNIAN